MSTYYPPTIHNGIVNGQFNPGDFSGKLGGSLTLTTADARYIQNTGKISAITWSGNHTFLKPLSVAVGDVSASNTFGGLSNIFNTTISCQSALTINQKYNLNIYTPITAATALSFPLSEVYYITPGGTNYTITLPQIYAVNQGARVQFRVVNTGTGSVNIAPSGSQYIFGTTTSQTTAVTIYTGGTSTIGNMITFTALPTALGGSNGWFQN